MLAPQGPHQLRENKVTTVWLGKMGQSQNGRQERSGHHWEVPAGAKHSSTAQCGHPCNWGPHEHSRRLG